MTLQKPHHRGIGRDPPPGMIPLDFRRRPGICTVYVISKKRADLLGHQLAMRLRAAYAHLRRRSNVAFAPFGMTSDQYVLLMVLAQMGEATQQQLVRSCFSDTATIGTMLSLLKAKGLITRMPHPRDGRAWSVKLTGPGRHMAEEMRRASARLRTELAGLFTEKELPLLIEFLGRLAAAMPPPARRSRNTITSSTRHANS